LSGAAGRSPARTSDDGVNVFDPGDGRASRSIVIVWQAKLNVEVDPLQKGSLGLDAGLARFSDGPDDLLYALQKSG